MEKHAAIENKECDCVTQMAGKINSAFYGYASKVWFMSEAQKNTFSANPLRYVPVLSGDCVTCLAKMSKRMPGNIRHAAYHRGRLYLFAGKDQKQMFLKDAASYANVDLALNGNCPVCRVEMQKDVPGNAKISTTLGGKRYLFPATEQQNMFLSNPKKYVAP